MGFYRQRGKEKFPVYAAPVLIGEQLILGDFGNYLYSIDLQDGTTNWIFEDAGSRWIGKAASVGEMILAPNADHILYALNDRGKEEWTFKTGHMLWASPEVDAKGVVYQSSMDHKLYAIDSASGDEIWSVDLGGALVNSRLSMKTAIYTFQHWGITFRLWIGLMGL